MNCDICNEILSQIEKIDKSVASLKAKYDSDYDRFVYNVVGGLDELIEESRQDYRKAMITWLKERKNQIKIHTDLSNHYREDHLLKKDNGL